MKMKSCLHGRMRPFVKGDVKSIYMYVYIEKFFPQRTHTHQQTNEYENRIDAAHAASVKDRITEEGHFYRPGEGARKRLRV